MTPMNPKSAYLFSLLLTTVAAADSGYNPLANGIEGDVTTTDGAGWSVEDSMLIPDRGEERGYVVTKNRYSDVEITLEFNPEAGTNSGIFARCQDPEVVTPQNCYEFNIWDAHADPKSRTGAIVTHSPPAAFVETEGKWNTMRIRVDGARLQVWVNDTLTNDIEADQLSEGHIAFQYGGNNGMVLFKNISIETIP